MGEIIILQFSCTGGFDEGENITQDWAQIREESRISTSCLYATVNN